MDSFLPGDGELATLIRTFDWTSTPLGPIETWPQSLRTATSLLVASPTAIVLLWGPHGVMIYNDAYAVFAAERHPLLLGSNVREGWPEVADFNDNVMKVGLAGGTLSYRDQDLTLSRTGKPERVFLNLDYSPVYDESGKPGGVIAIVVDTTRRVMAARHGKTLIGLTDRLRDLEEKADIAFAAAEMLGTALNASRVGYGTIDPDSDTLHVDRDWTADGVESLAGITQLRDYGSFIDSLKQNELIAIPDVREDERTAAASDALEERSARSFVNVPIVEQGRLVAVLFVNDAAERSWSPEDLALIREVAERTRTAVERARTQAALRESEALFRFLDRLGKAIAGLADADEILAATTRMVGEHLGVSICAYADMDEDEDGFTIRGDWSAPGSTSIRGHYSLADFGKLAVKNLGAGLPLIVNDNLAELAPEEAATFRNIGIAATICMPLVKEGRLTALMAIHDKEPRIWSANELNVIREVTERSWAHIERVGVEAELRASAEALRDLNETLEHRVEERTEERDRLWRLSEDMLAQADYQGRLLAVSPAWTRILGYSETELLSRPYADIIHPENIENVIAALRMMRETGQPARFENRILAANGEWTPIGWTVSPESDGIHFIAIGRDISAEKEAAAELERAQEALRQSQKMEAMGQLTGGVAHDFNNLLTPIVGSLDMLQRQGLGGPREQRLIQGAIQSADRAKTLVQRLLAFARRQPLQASAVDVTKLVTGMADLIASTSGPQIRVVTEAATDLPAAKADLNQLEMALLNLGVNARDAMPDGGTLRISADAETIGPEHRSKLDPGRYVRLSVADTGIGMNDATLKRAIEPFFSTKGIGKGTGLGLSMVHGLAAQLGGALSIESRPGVGTNVELWLPVSEAPVQEENKAADEATGPATRGTALLVDDEPLVRASTAAMLADLGYAVVEAGSAEEAVQLMADGLKPGILVTDHLMPGMSGTELAQSIRSDRPDLPILIVSGYAEVEGLAADLPRLTKPFRIADLTASLAALSKKGEIKIAP